MFNKWIQSSDLGFSLNDLLKYNVALRINCYIQHMNQILLKRRAKYEKRTHGFVTWDILWKKRNAVIIRSVGDGLNFNLFPPCFFCCLFSFFNLFTELVKWVFSDENDNETSMFIKKLNVLFGISEGGDVTRKSPFFPSGMVSERAIADCNKERAPSDLL